MGSPVEAPTTPEGASAVTGSDSPTGKSSTPVTASGRHKQAPEGSHRAPTAAKTDPPPPSAAAARPASACAARPAQVAAAPAQPVGKALAGPVQPEAPWARLPLDLLPRMLPRLSFSCAASQVCRGWRVACAQLPPMVDLHVIERQQAVGLGAWLQHQSVLRSAKLIRPDMLTQHQRIFWGVAPLWASHVRPTLFGDMCETGCCYHDCQLSRAIRTIPWTHLHISNRLSVISAWPAAMVSELVTLTVEFDREDARHSAWLHTRVQAYGPVVGSRFALMRQLRSLKLVVRDDPDCEGRRENNQHKTPPPRLDSLPQTLQHLTLYNFNSRWPAQTLEVMSHVTGLQHLNFSGCNFELPLDPAVLRHVTALEIPLSTAWIRHSDAEGLNPKGYDFVALDRLQLLDLQGVQFNLKAHKHPLNTHAYRYMRLRLPATLTELRVGGRHNAVKSVVLDNPEGLRSLALHRGCKMQDEKRLCSSQHLEVTYKSVPAIFSRKHWPNWDQVVGLVGKMPKEGMVQRRSAKHSDATLPPLVRRLSLLHRMIEPLSFSVGLSDRAVGLVHLTHLELHMACGFGQLQLDGDYMPSLRTLILDQETGIFNETRLDELAPNTTCGCSFRLPHQLHRFRLTARTVNFGIELATLQMEVLAMTELQEIGLCGSKLQGLIMLPPSVKKLDLTDTFPSAETLSLLASMTHLDEVVLPCTLDAFAEGPAVVQRLTLNHVQLKYAHHEADAAFSLWSK